MSSFGVMLTSVIGGGTGMVGVAGARWLSDERARRRTEKESAKLMPLRQKSYELRIAKQADEVLQETIDTLRKNYAELKKEFAQYRGDADEQRSRDLREFERQRALDHDELDRLHQQVNDQSAEIVQLKFELQQYRPVTGP